MTTITMFLTIAICALIVLLFLYFQIRPTAKTAATAPSILTSIGIFGTFLGIAIGLMHFDPDDVITSVPVFLGGIKLAFWSSVVGIFTALLHRVRFSIRPLETDMASEAESDSSALESLNRMKRSLTSLEGTMDSVGGIVDSGFQSVGTSLEDLSKTSRKRADEPSLQDLIDQMSLFSDKMQAGLQSMSDALLERFDSVGVGVREQSRMLGEELKLDGNILKSLINLKEEVSRNSQDEQNAVKTEMQRLLNEMIEDAKAEEEHSESLLEAMTDLNKQIVEGSEISRKAPMQKLEHLFGELNRSASRSMSELSDVAENLIDQAKWQNSTIAEDLIAANDSSTKSMLAMLKEILGATEDSNSKITTELAKLRTDVAANVRATTTQSKALVEQLHAMTESYKASLISTTAELKAQISKDMKSSYGLIDKYTQNVAEITSSNQTESMERLEAIANIMQGVVTSATDMTGLLHENTAGMNRMQDAFSGTSEGSLGRLLINMNENVVAQLASLETALEAEGSLGELMKDLNAETSKSLRSLEKSFESSIYEVKRIPKEIVKSLQKADKG